MEKRLQVGPGLRGCPFVTPAIPSTGTAAFYCRMPDGRVRIPAPDERATFCTSGRHYFCPVVQRYVRDH